MGEEITTPSSKLFFCRTEDIGTDHEKWTEMDVKSIDVISVREKSEVPKLDVKEAWPTSFTFTMTLENAVDFFRLEKKIREHHRKRVHYLQKVLPKEAKKQIRKFYYDLKVRKLKKK